MNQECTNTAADTSSALDDRILVTCADAARLLSLKPFDVLKLCEDGTLQHGRFGERILICLTSVRDYAMALTA